MKVRKAVLLVIVAAAVITTGRLIYEPVAQSIGRASIELTASAAGATEYVCRLEVTYMNKDRYWEGAPWAAECDWPHTVPFGNIGVDSNVGFRYNARQFRGWKDQG